MVELFYMQPLSEDAKRILREGMRLDLIQEPEKPSLEEAIAALEQAVQNGTFAAVKIGNFIFTLNRINAYSGNIHMALGHGATAKDTVSAAKIFSEWVWQNTQYLRLETRSPLKFTKSIGEATGADVVVIKNSFFDGKKLIDEYLASWTKPGF